ncbi:MAG: T9SS type A sorting domain-containing protein, partial [Bacteroidetes bacterium]|nr:T9SS type A sorting domain-containing protein [Bacteroidota bacterium]
SSISRYFDITTTNTVTANYFELMYDSTELQGASRGLLRLNYSSNSGSTWSRVVASTPTTANSAIGYVAKSGNTITLSTTTLKFTASDSVNSSLSPLFILPGSPTINNVVVKDNKVTAYPNPFADQLTIETELAAGIYSIAVMDLNGKIINKQNVEIIEGTNRMVLPTETFAKGIYIINISGNNSNYMIKVVKQ